MQSSRLAPLAIAAVLVLVFAVTPFTACADDVAPGEKYKVGDTAPDFSLKDQNGKDISLHDFRGKKKVIVAFYVFAFTGG